MDERKNAGYVITDSIHVGETEFVIGMNPADPAMFVTWACKGGDYFYWGHYMTDRTAAVRDLLERATEQLEFVERRQAMPQKEQEKERER